MEAQVPNELEDAVVAAQQGDHGALRAIYESLSPRVCGFLRLRGAEDPEALTNDVFVKVLPQLRNVQGGFPGVRALTFTVAHGLLVDDLRRRSRRPAQSEYESEDDPRVQPSAEDQAMDRSPGPAQDVLVLLPDDQRSVIVMRVLGELTVAETATSLGISQRAVRRLQTRAMANLRQFLQPGDGSLPTPGHLPPSEQSA